MNYSLREPAHLGSPSSSLGVRDEDATSIYSISQTNLAPARTSAVGRGLEASGRDDDSIWNWNNDVEKERQGGELMFNRPSDVSAIDTDEEEALERRNDVVEGMGSGDDDEDDYYEESMRSTYSVEEERKVVRKFDWHLTLFMAGLYMLSFLDRSNIGNAKVAGLESDLQLSSNQYEWALSAFYITYIVFEWMTLLYKIYPAHIYIAICVFFWGLSASLQSVIMNLPGLITLRACLGIAEAAFGPGLPFYLSFFYKREELALRTGLFISAAPLATSFAGSLAWLITSVTTSAQTTLAPWRALFLIEGFPSVFVAAFVWKYVPDRPGQAHYLSPRERKIAVLRLREERKAGEAAARKKYGGGGDSGGDASPESREILNWTDIGRTLKDPKAWLTALMFFNCNVAFSSLPVFLPTILKDMGYSSTTSQALTAPPYLIAFLTVILTAYHSDRLRRRSDLLILHALTSFLAYTTIALTGYFHDNLPPTLTTSLRYAAVYPAAAGFFSSITLIITWSMDNQLRATSKGAGVALMNVVGQCGPLLGTRLYPQSQGPWYVPGMGVCAVCMFIVAALALALRVILKRENERSRVGREGDMEIEMVSGEASGLMGTSRSGGSGSPERRADGFVYIL